MSKLSGWKRRGLLAAFGATLCAAGPTALAAPTGGFLVHLNENQSNSDSRRSVSIYDADELGAGPLFSVVIPLENFVASGDVSQNNYEETSAITVDPNTGDVYVLSFDSTSGTGMIGGVAFPGTEFEDTEGDYDIYKINFATVYDHWATNFQGTTAAGKPGVGGTTPKGTNNSSNLDYVTYGVGPRTAAGEFNGLHTGNLAHANTFVLPGAIEKIGEVNRNDPGTFYDPAFEFIDQNLLYMIDDSIANAPTDPLMDRTFRSMKTVAGAPVSDGVNGGYNRGTTQNWESTRQALVGLDVDQSEAESAAFYADSASGVRGMWVTESDGGGDDVAFMQIDASGNTVGYRPFSSVGNPTAFALDNDPFTATNTNDGKADNIFVDADTGDVIIVESGFGDAAGGIGTVDLEPSVLRLAVTSYDNGSGQIELGAWSQKVTLAPTKDPGDTTFLERGQWSAWDSANDKMYFLNPGAAGETPAFEMDITVLDLKVGSPTYGMTTTFLNTDESVSLFTNTNFGDKVGFFTLAAAPADDADFDNDDDVDGNDFLIWQRGFGVGNSNATGDANGNGVVDAADLAIWKTQFGVAAVAAAGAVPEPASLAMGGLGCLAFVASRRRRRA